MTTVEKCDRIGYPRNRVDIDGMNEGVRGGDLREIRVREVIVVLLSSASGHLFISELTELSMLL